MAVNLITTPLLQGMVDYENGWGTNKGSPTGKILAFDSEDLKSGQDLLENPEFLGRYTRLAKIPGNMKWAQAKFPHKATWDSLPWLSKAALGSLSTAANAGSGFVCGAATLTNGKVTSVAITTPGSNYVTPPALVLTGGTGSGAVVHCLLTAGAVSSIVIDNGGNYTVAPTGGTVTNNNTHTNDIGNECPSFLFERKVPFNAGNKFYLYNGCVMGAMSLKIGPTGFFNPEFSIKPGKLTIGAATYDGSATDLRTIGTVGARKVHHAMIAPASLLLDGATSTSLKLLDLTVNLTNELVEDEYIVSGGGALDAVARVQARVTVSATLSVRDQNIVDLIRGGLDHSLAMTWTDLDPAWWASLTLPALQFDITEPTGATRGAFRLSATAEAHEDGSQKMLTLAVSNAKANAFYL